jgi:hypothetical protein
MPTGFLTHGAAESNPSDLPRLMLDNELHAFVCVDANGRIVDWNRRAEQVTGWRFDEVRSSAGRWPRPSTSTGITPRGCDGRPLGAGAACAGPPCDDATGGAARAPCPGNGLNAGATEPAAKLPDCGYPRERGSILAA